VTPARLDRLQLLFHLPALLLGLLLGVLAPGLGAALEVAVWPVLGLLLTATFAQLPLRRLLHRLGEGRFLAAALLGNFLLVPLLLALLLPLLPADPAVRLGVLLVLLAPCTDWFVTFAQLGRGDGAQAAAATPVLLLAQLLLLPAWLWLLLGEDVPALAAGGALGLAFLTLILLPLGAAWLTQALRGGAPGFLAWWPVPLLSLVLFLVAASQAEAVRQALPSLGPVVAVFMAFLLAAPGLGLALGRGFGLSPRATRTLIFSLGTRNSFVVLPLALALPPAWAAAAVVIVAQSLVELLGLLAYLRVAPWLTTPSRRAANARLR